MTNTEIIQAIKAEIERLKDEYTDIAIDSHYGTVNANHVVDDLEQLLSVRSTLESENPTNLDKEFETEMNNYVGENGLVNCSEIVPIARHFYELGFRRAAEMYDEIEYNRQRAEESVPNDLEEAAKEYARYHYADTFSQELAENDFIAGSAWKEMRMLKDAVEGEVKYFRYLPEINYSVAKIEFAKIPDLKEGDNVRVIVCKKED